MTPPDTEAPLGGQAPIVAEELSNLTRIRTWLVEHPEGAGTSEDEVVDQIIKLQADIRTARADDRAALTQQLEHLSALLRQIRRGRAEDTVDPDSPYFGHLRLQEGRRTMDLYLGKATRLEPGVRIVDWRNAPISRIFYRYEEGDEYVEEVADSWREGTVTARRTLHIANGELLRIANTDGAWVRGPEGWSKLEPGRLRLAGGEGQALRAGRKGESHLGAGQRLRADKHLPDIAALIDPEQFDLITAEDAGVVVLRGSAGSGKTTVALHRVAWLCFNDPNRFRPHRILVIVWGRALRDYVAHVLPALGVSGVQVTTWDAWSRTAVQRHFPELPLDRNGDTPEPVTRLKLHAGLTRLLERHIRAHRGPATSFQAIDDWAVVITDRAAIAAELGDDLPEHLLDRVIDWTTAQVAQIFRRLEGDRDMDLYLDAEDDALLLRAWQLRVGRLRVKGGKPLTYAHIVLDEVQDFSPVEVQVLLGTADSRQCVTLAGDTRQHISQHAGFASWTDFLDRIGVSSKALSTLAVSYRSTHPVTRFALDVLGDHEEAAPRTTRDGPPVELFRFSDHGAAVAFLGESLKRLFAREPLANIALLTPDPEHSVMYWDGLRRAEVPRMRLVEQQRFAFAPGVDVVEASEVKGLEFDYVIVIEVSGRFWPDTDHHRRLLHVAATRAVHQLWLTCVGNPSSILPQIMTD